ncbi:unnamed protein product [Anisakis simplex]|uniref:F5/8 type C domain-containing protein n=1 Tax=Anisakis simplex TaxID=6269 RepID=A0A0M3J0Z4_ANISI|nr:unnamed protein product [Anisakis simplex]
MIDMMSQYVHWDRFLYDLPIMVTEIGKLMLFSDKHDFTLNKDGATYQYIQRHESFRALPVQVGRNAINIVDYSASGCFQLDKKLHRN